MDEAQYDRMTEWVRENVGENGVAKDELLARVDASALPQEAKRVFQELPAATLSQEDLLARLHEISTEMFGLGQSTTMAAKFGGDGIFGE